MRVSPLQQSPLLTDRLLCRLASKPALLAALFPAGPDAEPYEVLSYDATLTLLDCEGTAARFDRTQRVRFLQDGVSAIFDHFWGDGVVVTRYDHNVRAIGETFKDEMRRHLVLELQRPMRRGEILELQLEREARLAFTQAEEWLETRVDHPTARIHCQVMFPTGRPCRGATLQHGELRRELPVRLLPDGRTALRFEALQPDPNLAFLIRWQW